jgi:N-acetylglucosamine transport system substrate-binding protein
MTSLPVAKRFVQEKGTLMAIKDSDEGGDLPEVLKTPSAVLKASKTVYAVQFRHWYPTLSTEIENGLTSLLNGQLTAEAFCNRVEAAATKVREDPNITKHQVAE